MADLVRVKINGKEYSVERNTTILDACRQVGIKIPTLCYLREINEIGACRVCVVEVVGARNLVASCVYPIDRDGMEIKTNTKRVLESRKTTVELLLSNHNNSCNSCVRSNNCELQKLSHELGCDENRYKGVKQSFEEDFTPYLVRDNSKCILCRRCVAACSKLQHVHVIGPNDRGFNTNIGSEFDLSLNDVKCVACGQCITVCPTGALRERDNIDDVMAVMNDKSKHVFAMTAPAVRAAIGEEFGYPIGTNTEGKMVAALKMLGFEKVMDVDFAADVTIMEEGTELLNRIKNNGVLPMITSCSPGWINYIEQYYPELLPHLSTTKSPQQIHGALIKSYYAKKHNLDPKDIVVVSIMPCVAKKVEINRPHINAVEEGKDVDFVLTTREAARFIRRAGIDFRALPDEQFDTFSGTSAGLLFGATGGVMEAALRTVKEILDGKELDNLDFKSVRGVKGVKKATVELGGKPVKVVVAHGVENAHTVMEQLKAGKLNDVAFIEIMCCPGGCVTGGGQPIQPAEVRNNIDLKAERAKALYNADKKAPLRKSHDNPEVKELYADFLGEPNGHLAHELLHTHYVDRSKKRID